MVSTPMRLLHMVLQSRVIPSLESLAMRTSLLLMLLLLPLTPTILSPSQLLSLISQAQHP